MKQPRTIVTAQSPNFETLRRVFANDDAALVECTIEVDKLFERGEKVAAVCAVQVRQTDAGPTYEMVPFALMMNGNPYELLSPPAP